MTAFDLAKLLDTENSLEQHGLIVERVGNLDVRANVEHIKCHSTGFEVGYPGSGPADLALSVLHRLIPPPNVEDEDKLYELPMDEFDKAEEDPTLWSVKAGPGQIRVSRLAWDLHQLFKERFLAPMDKEGGTVDIATIRSWIAEETEALKARK